MEFSRLFRSIHTIVFFVFISFTSSFGMKSEAPSLALPSTDSISQIKVDLAKYLFLTQNSEGQLIHEGISSIFGKYALVEMLDHPATTLEELTTRQAILKELVSLPNKEFNSVITSFRALVPDTDLIYKLSAEIDQQEKQVAFLKENMFKFFGGPSRGVMVNALSQASNALTIYMTWARGMEMYHSCGESFNSTLAMSALVSVFLGAMFQYLSGLSASSLIPANILQQQLLTGSPERFVCDNYFAVATTVSGREKLVEEGCKQIGATPSTFGKFVPGFIKTAAGKTMAGLGVAKSFVANLPVISHVSSSAPWRNSSLFFCSGLIDLLHMDRLILYVKYSRELSGKKKRLEDTKKQLRDKVNGFVGKFENLNVSRNAKISNNPFTMLDIYLGLTSLIRESNKRDSGSTRFKFGFVDFIESDQEENRFEMSIKDLCGFSSFKPDNAYKTANIFSKYFILPALNFNVSKDNQFSVDSKKFNQVEFLSKFMKPIYSQMLLAHTFGIVWGESAQMSFIDMNKISFVSNAQKAVYHIVFPAN